MTTAFSHNSSEPAKPLVREPGIPADMMRSARDIAAAQRIPTNSSSLYKTERLGTEISAQK